MFQRPCIFFNVPHKYKVLQRSNICYIPPLKFPNNCTPQNLSPPKFPNTTLSPPIVLTKNSPPKFLYTVYFVWMVFFLYCCAYRFVPNFSGVIVSKTKEVNFYFSDHCSCRKLNSTVISESMAIVLSLPLEKGSLDQAVFVSPPLQDI